MTPRAGLLAGLIVLTAAPALAQLPPRLVPSRDVAVTYALQGPNVPPGTTMRVMTAAQGTRVRVEMPNELGYGIMDPSAGRMTMVMPAMNMAMEVPLDPAMQRMILNPQAQFQRLGSRTVAGLACTDYRVSQAQQPPGTVCLTADGVLLRAEGGDPGGGAAGVLEAVQVSTAAIPASAFAVPANIPRMQMPPGMAEMLQRMGQGGGMPGMPCAGGPGGMPGLPPGMPGRLAPGQPGAAPQK
jgi:hypothetical protein